MNVQTMATGESQRDPEPIRRAILESLENNQSLIVRNFLNTCKGCSKEQVAEKVKELEAESEILLLPPRFSSFLGYLISFRWSLEFWILIPFEALVFFAIFFVPSSDPWILLRAGLSLIFLVIVPGFYLSSIVFPKSIGYLE